MLSWWQLMLSPQLLRFSILCLGYPFHLLLVEPVAVTGWSAYAMFST